MTVGVADVSQQSTHGTSLNNKGEKETENLVLAYLMPGVKAGNEVSCIHGLIQTLSRQKKVS